MISSMSEADTPRVSQSLLARTATALHQIVYQLLELGPTQRHLQMLGTRLVRRHKRQVDLRLTRRRQLALRLLSRLLQALQGHRVFAQIDPLRLLEFTRQPVDDALVKIIATKMRVPVRRLYLEHPVTQLQYRDVERAATQIIHANLLRMTRALVHPISQGRRRRLVDDPQHVQPRNLTHVLRRLTLRVVEIGRHRDHRLRHRLAKVILRRLLHLLKHHRRDLRRRMLLSGTHLRRRHLTRPLHHLEGHLRDLLGYLVVVTTHEPLDRKHRVRRVRHRLTLRRLTHQTLTLLRKGHHRRRRTTTLRIRDHLRLLPLHHRYTRIRRPKVYPYYLCHRFSSPVITNALHCRISTLSIASRVPYWRYAS